MAFTWCYKGAVVFAVLYLPNLFLAEHVCEDGLDNLDNVPYPSDFKCNGTCVTSRDPHFHTFDCVKYSYQGKCKYTLVTNCDGDLADFEIIGEFEQLFQKTTVMTTLVIYGDMTTIELSSSFGVILNGVTMTTDNQQIPFATIERYCNAVIVTLSNGITVYWSDPHRAIIRISPEVAAAFNGNVCGLCGNFNGIRYDDFTIKDTDEIGNIVEFAESWRIRNECAFCEDCESTACGPARQHNQARQLAEHFCAIFKNGMCPDQFLYELCMDIMCAALPETAGLCHLIEISLDVCLQIGTVVIDIAKEALCNIILGDPECTGFVDPDSGNNGKCIATSDCPGDKYISNLCPSYPADVKCCFTA